MYFSFNHINIYPIFTSVGGDDEDEDDDEVFDARMPTPSP